MAESRSETEIAVPLVAPGESGGWSIQIRDTDGAVVLAGPLGGPATVGDAAVGSLYLSHADYGSVSAGAGPNGYTQWWARERRDGAVVVPYFLDNRDSRVWVGVLRHRRGTVAGGAIYELPRGAGDEGEPPRVTAARELAEETGVGNRLAERLIPSGGAPANPASSNFETAEGEGAHFFLLEVQRSELLFAADAATPSARLRPDLIDAGRTAEEISARAAECLDDGIDPEGLVFLPLTTVIGTADGFTKSGIGVLCSHLIAEGRLVIDASR